MHRFIFLGIRYILFLRTYEGIPKRAIEPEFSSFRNSYKSEEHNKFQELVKKYGKVNSLLLTLAHIVYYFSALYEAYTSGTTFNYFSVCGVFIMGFAYAMLFYVIYKLHDVWTVKLYIIPDHRIEKSFLFRTVRHPNYYLNIIPELIGIALLCNAWYTLLIGLPIYACLLAIRIRQEERAMKELLEN